MREREADLVAIFAHAERPVGRHVGRGHGVADVVVDGGRRRRDAGVGDALQPVEAGREFRLGLADQGARLAAGERTVGRVVRMQFRTPRHLPLCRKTTFQLPLFSHAHSSLIT